MKITNFKTGGRTFLGRDSLNWESWEIQMLKNGSTSKHYIKCIDLMFKTYVL